MTQSDEVAGLELALAQAAAMIERLQSHKSILLDCAKDVIAWCDANPPAGDALYCIARLRHGIATFDDPPLSDIAALREERDAFRASSEIRGEEIARLRGLIAAHVNASNNDDSAGDTFGALAEAVQDAP